MKIMEKRKLYFLLSALMILIATANTAHGEILFGPYLQSLSQDSVAICVGVDKGDKVKVILKSTDQGDLEFAAKGNMPACANLSGLVLDIEYQYNVLINEKPVFKDDHVSFLAGSKSDTTIVIFGDTRSGDNSFDLSHRQVVQSIIETVVPDAIINTGDFVEKGDSMGLWTNYFLIEKDLLKSTPVYPAIGRSDQPSELMQTIFPLLADSPWYSFDRGGSHFVVLKVWLARSQDEKEVSLHGAQATWLREDLGKAAAAGAKHIFVVMHQPPVDLNGNSFKEAAEVFMPIFETYNVTAVFSGAHYFSHAVKNNVNYFTNGGGGALLESQNPGDGVFRFYNPIHHFLILEVGEGGSRVRAVNAQGEDFYQVSFDTDKTEGKTGDVPTFVKSYGSGKVSIPITVFFNYECGDCDSFKEGLLGFADDAQVTIVATFRSLANTENKAALDALAPLDGPTPVVKLGDELFVGLVEIEAGFSQEITKTSQKQQSSTMGTTRIIIIIAVLVAGGLLLFLLFSFRKKSS